MISGGEIFLILLFVLILFGANKIPELAKGLGKGVREFKKASDDIKREISSVDGGILSDLRKDVDEIKSNRTETFEKEAINPAEDLADAVNQADSDSNQATWLTGAAAVGSAPEWGNDTSAGNYNGDEPAPELSDYPQPTAVSVVSAAPSEQTSSASLDEPVMDDYYYRQQTASVEAPATDPENPSQPSQEA